MKIVHITGIEIEEPKKLSRKEMIHQEALNTVAVQMHIDRQTAEDMFLYEAMELESLRKQRELLKTQ